MPNAEIEKPAHNSAGATEPPESTPFPNIVELPVQNTARPPVGKVHEDCCALPLNETSVAGTKAPSPGSGGLPKAASPTWPEPYPDTKVRITRRGVLYVGFPCNMKCKFCYYSYHESREWHSLDECKRDALLFREKFGNRYVDITGGEPTIYPHIFELLDYCNSIGLKPTIITNVQALASEDCVKQLSDLGINDFLCSVHALGNTYNDLVQSRHGWKNLTQGIENLNKYRIPWRANCTMTRLNMIQLNSIAQWVKERNARIVNFINFNPFEEWQTKMDIDFQARHREIGPYLRDALAFCDQIGLEANVRYFPFCHMRGHEEKCINFQQLSYDPHEWDFCSWYAPETRAPSDKLPGSARIASTSEEELHTFIAQVQKRSLYVQEGGCERCSLQFICDGFTRQYHSRFGMKDAAPYDGEFVTDSTIFIAKREGSAFVHGPGRLPECRAAMLTR